MKPVGPASPKKTNKHRGAVVWLTGLPGSGKTTVARAVGERLSRSGYQTVVLDGDAIRLGLSADLGYSEADRNENVRRVGEIAKLFFETGAIVIAALISPMRGAREKARQLIPAGDFIEVYCDCPPAQCRDRDPKGHYAKAAAGAMEQFTGVTSPYEVPISPELTLHTGSEEIIESVERLHQYLLSRKT